MQRGVRKHGVRLAEVRLELQRPKCRGASTWESLAGRLELVKAEQAVRLRQSELSQRIRRIPGERRAKELDGAVHAHIVAPIQLVPAAKIEVVDLGVGGVSRRRGYHGLHFASR